MDGQTDWHDRKKIRLLKISLEHVPDDSDKKKKLEKSLKHFFDNIFFRILVVFNVKYGWKVSHKDFFFYGAMANI